MNNQTMREQFLALSAVLTDFNHFALEGTGQVDTYLNATLDVVGKEGFIDLLTIYENISNEHKSTSSLYQALRTQLLGTAYFGPVVRNIIKLWYTGMWYQLPTEWRLTYGAKSADTTHFITDATYAEGLLWQAIAANPSGAKAPGFGSWQFPPNIDYSNRWQPKSSS